MKRIIFTILALWHVMLYAQPTISNNYFKEGYKYLDVKSDQHDPEKAFGLFKQAAADGDISSLCKLGLLFETGIGTERNLDSAAYYYQLVAAKADAPSLYNLACIYYNGAKEIPCDLSVSSKLFKLAAAKGDGPSMCKIGNMYMNKIWFPYNRDSMMHYFQMAADKNYAGGFCELGNLYRFGWYIPQDFKQAVYYFQQGMLITGDSYCRNLIAYMNYKGLGLAQNYTTAFLLYKKLAEEGDKNAMYFTGACYNNGYGTVADTALARYWFTKSSDAGEHQSLFRLDKNTRPENSLVYNPGLEKRVSTIRSYTEKFAAASTNNISGKYKGYAIYYDFSGRYVIEAVPLELDIEQKNGGYEGFWKEKNAHFAPIKARFLNNKMIFDSSNHYIRNNQYNAYEDEDFLFKDAALSIKFMGDSLYLSGDVHFYSTLRREPAEPVYVVLNRKMSNTGHANISGFSIFPNPACSEIQVGITLNNTKKIQFQLIGIDGSILQQTPSRSLPEGTYTYSFALQNLAPGNYLIKLLTKAGTQSKLFIKK